MRDQLVEELGADQRMQAGHHLALEVRFDMACDLGAADDQILVVGELEVDRLLGQAKGRVPVVEGVAGPVLGDTQQCIDPHVLQGLGMFRAHAGEFPRHHGDQRVFRVCQAQATDAADFLGQHDIVVRDVRYGEGTHFALVVGADGGRGTEGDGRQQTQFAFDRFDGDVALRDGLGGKQAELADTAIGVGQQLDGGRHLGQRETAGIEGIDDYGHGETPGKVNQATVRTTMP